MIASSPFMGADPICSGSDHRLGCSGAHLEEPLDVRVAAATPDTGTATGADLVDGVRADATAASTVRSVTRLQAQTNTSSDVKAT